MVRDQRKRCEQNGETAENDLDESLRAKPQFTDQLIVGLLVIKTHRGPDALLT
jgi:hypothetical protein